MRYLFLVVVLIATGCASGPEYRWYPTMAECRQWDEAPENCHYLPPRRPVCVPPLITPSQFFPGTPLVGGYYAHAAIVPGVYQPGYCL